MNILRPDLERLIRVSEVLVEDVHPKVAEPVLRAQARGVLGWCVGRDGEVCELYTDRAAPLNLHDLPVPVAAQAFVNDWLAFEDLHQVLQARGQIMGPGDESIFFDEDDQHYHANCHCGWGEIFLDEAVAERELDGHLGSHLY